MESRNLRAAVALALAGSAGATAQVAWAQSSGGLEEIVVTATRRAQDLQEVPISIVAITGEGLETRGLDSLEDVSAAVPNLIITGGGGGTAGTNFRVRGIPNVGTYVDGVWQVGTAGLLTQEFVEIDRVEILRGPQGTMFGRDSTGGALRIFTKRPSEEFGGDVTATVGTLDRADVKASVDIPLTDNLLTKWTAASLFRDGYIHSLTTNENNGGIDQDVLRGDVVWTPTEKLNFRFNYQSNESEFTEPRVQDAIFNTYAEMGQVIGIPEFYGLAGAEAYTPINQTAGFPGGKVGKWENRSDITLPDNIITEQLSMETRWDLTDRISLQFLTAKTEQDSDQYVDWDSSQYAIVNDFNRSRLEVFSQEIQLTGGTDRIKWLGGLYYWDQKTINRNGRWVIEEFRPGSPKQTLSFAPILASPQCQAPVPPGYLTCQQTIDGALPGGSNGPFDVFSIAEQDGWAAFGEMTFSFTEKLDLTIGVRQHDQSGYSQNLAQIPGVTAPKPVTVNLEHTGGDPFAGTKVGVPNAFQFDKLTSRGVLQYQFNPNLMAYLSYSEGFNSGGVSAPVIQGQRREFAFKPSTLENTEIGMRWDLLDGRLRFNATMFDTIWADLQAAGVVHDPITGVQIPTLVTTNVGEAEADGFEFELTIVPTESILVNLNLGLLDTAYTAIAPGTMSGHLPLNSGTEFQQAPDETYSIGFQHTASLNGGGEFMTRIDYNYQGQFWRSEPFLRVSAYQAVPDAFEESGDVGTVNARLTYRPAAGNWNVSLFGTNLTDEYAINSGFFHGIWGYDFATVARPREAGVALNFQFD